MSDFTTVDTRDVGSAPVDAALAPQPEAPEYAPVTQAQDGTVAISELLGRDGSAEDAQGAQGPLGQTEPAEGTQPDDLKVDSGFQGRVNAQIQKEVTNATRRLQAEYDAKFAPLVERLLNMDADALVSSGKVADRETALEYLRMKNGMPDVSTPESPEKPRDAQGRFTAQKASPDTEKRAAVLRAEAETIIASGGPNVWEIFNTNDEARLRVTREGWSFADIAREYGRKPAAQPEPKEHVPSPVRTPNHTRTVKSFLDMSDEELAQLEKRVRVDGVRYDLRR